MTEPDDVDRLLAELGGLPGGSGERSAGLNSTVLYFALPPSVTRSVCEILATRDLGGLALALEKPFGLSLDEARDLNRLLASFRAEEQVFRVDHFLGKAQVLNLLGLRFANQLFEATWDNRYVERVEIIADETLALEGRAGYYDHAGALVDMHQSHLLLMLALVVMEEPARIDALELRDLMVHALRATRLTDAPERASRRARYTAGRVGGEDVPAYVDEPGVDRDRETETLAELDLVVDSRRWAGVPFLLRSGKALGSDARRIVVHYRPLAHVPIGLTGRPPANRLVIELSPDRLDLRIATSTGGDAFDVAESTLSADLGDNPLRPYGEILAAVLDRDPLLSVRGDVAEECWRICDPVLAAWRADEVPLEEYPAGSNGPAPWAPTGSARA